MVNRKQFEEICNKYGLDSKKLIKNNDINYCKLVLKDALKQFAFDYEECITLSANEIVIKPIIK